MLKCLIGGCNSEATLIGSSLTEPPFASYLELVVVRWKWSQNLERNCVLSGYLPVELSSRNPPTPQMSRDLGSTLVEILPTAAMKTYQRYVELQSKRNPCLSTLCRFLADPKSSQYPSRAAVLEFVSGSSEPFHRTVQEDDLYSVISQGDNGGWRTQKVDIQGRIVIIEDVSRNIVETLGSSLNIDPLFFASYIYATYRDITAQTPDLATLPSRTRHFLNIQYHRTIVFQKGSDL